MIGSFFDHMDDGDAHFGLDRRQECVCRVAGNGKHSSAGLLQQLGAGDQCGRWISSMGKQGLAPVRNCGIGPYEDLKVLLVDSGRCCLDQLQVEVRRGHWPHAPQYAHNTPPAGGALWSKGSPVACDVSVHTLAPLNARGHSAFSLIVIPSSIGRISASPIYCMLPTGRKHSANC